MIQDDETNIKEVFKEEMSGFDSHPAVLLNDSSNLDLPMMQCEGDKSQVTLLEEMGHCI